MPYLDDIVSGASAAAINLSTNQAYGIHFQSYLAFCHVHHLPIAPTPTNLARYMAYMSKFIKPSSINTYLSGIVYHLRPLYPEISQLRYDSHVKSVLRGLLRQGGSQIHHKQPITFHQLDNLFLSYTNRSYDDLLFLALMTVGFFGLLRLGELTDPNDRRLINCRKTTQRHSLFFRDDAAHFSLPASKTDRFFAGNEVVVTMVS